MAATTFSVVGGGSRICTTITSYEGADIISSSNQNGTNEYLVPESIIQIVYDKEKNSLNQRAISSSIDKLNARSSRSTIYKIGSYLAVFAAGGLLVAAIYGGVATNHLSSSDWALIGGAASGGVVFGAVGYSLHEKMENIEKKRNMLLTFYQLLSKSTIDNSSLVESNHA